ncbi:MAG: aminopeptidase N, partial [Gammaproteobacteria bacterium]|nr:aminopeptidase N [Gammaproteobacteria bacterium]
MKDGQPKAIHLKDYEAPNYLVETTELHFDLDEEATTVTSKLEVRRNPQGSGSSELTLDGSDLELVEVSIDGRALSGNEYRLEDETLTLFDVAEQAVIACTTRIDPKANTALEGLYLSGPMFCTQCEAEGFRRITFYPDRPDVMSRFTTTIVADDKRYPVMLSNGNEVARERTDDGRLSVTWEDPFPKPAYLFALVAGDLSMIEDRFTTMSGREVTLRIFSEPHNIGKCGYAMESLKRAMRWDEEVYGREYDLDVFMIVAVDTFNMGAMENKGLNVFNTSCVLADPKTTTDQGFKRVEAVVAHEYFHNWSGNRVTCRDWFQLSLKEGFTVFRDGEFSSDMGSRTVKRIEDVNFLRTAQFVQDGGPMAHPIRPDSYIEISNFYTLTVYEKGAEVVRMIHTLLGPEGFRRGTDLYFERHDGEAVTTDDFVAAMEDANEFDLGQFRRWYAQAGTPVVKVEREYDEKTRTLSLTLEQSCPPTPGQETKEAFHIPFALGLLSDDGREMLGASGRDNGFEVGIATHAQVDNPRGDGTLVLHLKDKTQRIAFDGVDAGARVSLLRGFSAPVRLEAERSADELRFLMLYDADGFARWDAGQEYYVRVLRGAVQEIQAGGTVTLDEGLVETFRGLLDRALKAADDGEE